MQNPVTIEELKKVVALRNLSDEHLEWILAHSEYEEFKDGDTVLKTGEPTEHMGIIVEGKMNFYLNINGRLVYYFSFENNDLAGGLSGLLPYSRMQKSPGTSYAIGTLRMIKIHKKYFQELERLNPEFIQRLIGYMTERARVFATTQMQQEKVSALGKLAAGIAHELNNPAAAISRISEELDKRLRMNIELTEKLLDSDISPKLIKNIRELVKNKEKNNSTNTKITSLQLMQNEDDLNDWLDNQGLNIKSELAETFAEAGFSPADLESIKSDTGSEAFQNIIVWLENLLSSEIIIKDLNSASDRISLLVGAIKSHVHLDRTGGLHPTDLHKDIEDTIILLGYKIREKHINLKKIYCDDFPKVEAYIGELNQVWTNIIDNAIYAVPQNGEILIETQCSNKDISVQIIDNGAGIPKDILSRIFDPFFTTKKVGDGTGIGLDIVKNIIKRHNGDIKVSSIPGKTEFIISLPISQNSSTSEVKDETSIHNNN